MPSVRSHRFPTPFRAFAASLLGLALLLVVPSGLRAQPEATPSVPAKPAATPLAESRTTLKSLYESQSQATASATSDSDLAKAHADLRAGKEALSRRATELAAASPPSAENAELLLFVLTDLADTDAAAEAAQLVAKDYPARAVRIAFAVAVQPQLWSEDFLSELAKLETLPPNQRLPVEFCGAMHRRSLLFLHDEAARPFPEALELLKKSRGEAFVAWLQSLDGDALSDETIARFEQLREQYGEKKLGGPTVAEHAEASIRAVREFRLGMPAPPMTGKDLEGEPLRLEDSRGKVVLLTFWASWCAPCITEMARERELRQRLDGDDFAILGVCLDEDLEAARKTASDAGVTWKSFADRNHSLAEAWFAMQLPTCAVVDRDGTLQARGVPLERAEKIVERLLREPDAGATEGR